MRDPAPHVGPRLVYRAGPGILYRVAVGVLLAGLAVAFLGGASMSLLRPERPRVLLATLLVAAFLLLGTGVALLLRPAFIVTTEGITVRGYVRTRRMDWASIAHVEVDRSFFDRGATVVVLRDGRRVRCALTGSRFALHRGESMFDHGSDLLQPARPTRAAIDAHRRWLRGGR